MKADRLHESGQVVSIVRVMALPANNLQLIAENPRRTLVFKVTGISVLAIPAPSGNSNARLGCKVFVLLSRPMLGALQFRLPNTGRSPLGVRPGLHGGSPSPSKEVPLRN